MFEELKKEDKLIYDLIEAEKKRQMEGIELIPSENLISLAVMQAMGSYPNNKYSEGYPALGQKVIGKVL